MIPNWYPEFCTGKDLESVSAQNTGNAGRTQCCRTLALCSICKITRRQACCCLLRIDPRRPSASQVVEASQPKPRTAVVPSDSVLTHRSPGGPDRLQTPPAPGPGRLFLDPLVQHGGVGWGRGGVPQLAHEAQSEDFLSARPWHSHLLSDWLAPVPLILSGSLDRGLVPPTSATR